MLNGFGRGGVSTAIVIAGALLFGGVALHLWTPVSRVQLFPGPDLEVNGITDVQSGGTSFCKWETQVSALRFAIGMRPGAPYPYAGVKLLLNQNLRDVRWIEIQMQADSGAAFRFALKSPAPELGRSDDPSAMFYHEVEYEPRGIDTLKRIPIEEFKFPRWWRIREKWPTDQALDRLVEVREIEILNGFAQVQRDTIRAELRSIVAGKSSASLRYISLGMILGGTLLLVVTLILQAKRAKKSKPSRFEGYKPVELSSQELSEQALQERLMSHLKEHFSDSDYSLETLAKGVGVSERQASEALRQATGMHFKAALNELRLSEAMRLLKEGQGSVSEIAYSVGFNQHAHFTRAFKAKFGKSPSEMKPGAGSTTA